MLRLDIPIFWIMMWTYFVRQKQLPGIAAVLMSPESCRKCLLPCFLWISQETWIQFISSDVFLNIRKLLIFLLVRHPTTDLLLPLFFLFNVAYPRYRLSLHVIRDHFIFVMCYISTITVRYNALIIESREIFSLNQTSPLVLTVTMYINIFSHNQYTLHEKVITWRQFRCWTRVKIRPSYKNMNVYIS